MLCLVRYFRGENLSIEQIIVLAVVQGITEFRPISSSGHLILIPFLTGWPDQGQFTDVMSHLGTLLAVLIYFWRDVRRLISGTLMLFRGKVTELKGAVLIGCAQALALIPGTSRSGVTMTAARFLNFTRPDAARFRFFSASRLRQPPLCSPSATL